MSDWLTWAYFYGFRVKIIAEIKEEICYCKAHKDWKNRQQNEVIFYDRLS